MPVTAPDPYALDIGHHADSCNHHQDVGSPGPAPWSLLPPSLHRRFPCHHPHPQTQTPRQTQGCHMRHNLQERCPWRWVPRWPCTETCLPSPSLLRPSSVLLTGPPKPSLLPAQLCPPPAPGPCGEPHPGLYAFGAEGIQFAFSQMAESTYSAPAPLTSAGSAPKPLCRPVPPAGGWSSWPESPPGCLPAGAPPAAASPTAARSLPAWGRGVARD